MSHFCRLPGKIPTLQYPLAFLVHLFFFFWQKSGITFPLSHPFAIAKAFQRCKRTSQQKENHNGPHSGLIPYCHRKMSFLQWQAMNWYEFWYSQCYTVYSIDEYISMYCITAAQCNNVHIFEHIFAVQSVEFSYWAVVHCIELYRNALNRSTTHRIVLHCRGWVRPAAAQGRAEVPSIVLACLSTVPSLAGLL